MQEKIKLLSEKIKNAELILIGIGEQFAVAAADEEKEKAYRSLTALAEGRNYFVITLCEDQTIWKSGLREDRIVCPLENETNVNKEEKKTENNWERYMKWLQGTLNRKLLVLELEVGLMHPNLIRFPFEKVVFYNQKAELIRIHHKLFQLPAELNGRGISIKEDAALLLAGAEI